jgi:hypothetical protein
MENHAVDIPWWDDPATGVLNPLSKTVHRRPETPGLAELNELREGTLRYPGYFEPTPNSTFRWSATASEHSRIHTPKTEL